MPVSGGGVLVSNFFRRRLFLPPRRSALTGGDYNPMNVGNQEDLCDLCGFAREKVSRKGAKLL
jgi:hypothetical protein